MDIRIEVPEERDKVSVVVVRFKKSTTVERPGEKREGEDENSWDTNVVVVDTLRSIKFQSTNRWN